MSKIDSTGMEHGKRGNAIYVVLNGQQIKKELYRPTTPRTPAQQKHRSKIGTINRLSAHLAEAINLGFLRVAEAAKNQSPRNAFVKANWDNGTLRWNEKTSTWQLNPEQLLLAQGPRHIPANLTADVEGNTLRITCPDPELSNINAAPDDQLLVALYLPELPALKLYTGPLRADFTQCTFQLPDAPHTTQAHVYAWFQATHFHRATHSRLQVRPDQSSPSRHLTTFRYQPPSSKTKGAR